MKGWRSLFPNAWYIAVREFRGRIGSRSFAVGTVLLAAIAFAATQVPVLIDFTIGTSQTRMAVVVRADGLPTDARAMLEGQLNGSAVSDPKAHQAFALSWLQAGDMAGAQQDLEQGKLDALLIIDRDPVSHNLAFTLRTDLAADGQTVRSIDTAATWLALEDGLARAGTSVAAVARTPFTVLPVSSSAGGTNSISQEVSANVLSTGLIVLIFMAIITYGTWVAMSVAEEKGSRVMELMLNATTPLQMLAGKVIGNGAAGLTQYGIILAAVVGGLLAQGPIHELVLGSSGSGAPFGGLNPTVLGAFVVLFALGFLLYSLLYAALGSLVSRQEDVQSATSPLMVLIMLGYFMSIFGLQAIDETWVKVASFVPFFSPYLMLARVSMGGVAPWEFGLAVVLMLISIVVALVVAARIYGAGVLLYGQRVGLRQILKAARVSR
ncbi:MAG: ABC transporter permease [Candidatus Limnocylindrales bacterium]|jgi:ABC-2 type transport system permease protein